ncbi:MAG: phosphoribosylglycinamide formyltransferase [Marinilabiliaceae bacterium]|nr:phosphoribosylglycinamide formyltransferase [Marinilabiliaceae bacterium]
MKNIIIFASGSGSNAENIVRYFSSSKNVTISYIVSNKKEAFVLKRAEMLNIKSLVFEKKDFYENDSVLNFLLAENPNLIILSGFLILMPPKIIDAFPKRIVNIHPALLPKYGGKGMYGNKVHEAVIYNKEKETGITIHYVNDKYDEGEIIFQQKCIVDENETLLSLSEKIHALEYEFFPKVIGELAK